MEDSTNNISFAETILKQTFLKLLDLIAKENLKKNLLFDLYIQSVESCKILEEVSRFLVQATNECFEGDEFKVEDFFFELILEKSKFAELGFHSLENKLIEMQDALMYLLTSVFRSLIHKEQKCKHQLTEGISSNCIKCIQIKTILNTIAKKEDFLGTISYKYSTNFYNKYKNVYNDFSIIVNSLSATQAKVYGSILNNLIHLNF